METEQPSENSHDRWNNEETIKLIHVYEGLLLTQIFDGPITDSDAYKLLVGELANYGIVKTMEQVRSKLEALKKSYKEVKDSLRVSGAGETISFPYFDLMDTFLGNREDNIIPVISVDIGFSPLDKENVTLDDCDVSGAADDTFSESTDNEEVGSNNMSVTGMSNLPSSSTPRSKGRKLKTLPLNLGKGRKRKPKNLRKKRKERKKKEEEYLEALGKVLGEVADKLLTFEQKMEEKAEERREIFRQKLLAQNQEMIEILKKSLAKSVGQ